MAVNFCAYTARKRHRGSVVTFKDFKDIIFSHSFSGFADKKVYKTVSNEKKVMLGITAFGKTVLPI